MNQFNLANGELFWGGAFSSFRVSKAGRWSMLGVLKVLGFTCSNHGLGYTCWGGGECPGFGLQLVVVVPSGRVIYPCLAEWKFSLLEA